MEAWAKLFCIAEIYLKRVLVQGGKGADRRVKQFFKCLLHV